MKRRIQNFIILATTILLLNGVMFTSCRKADVSETLKTEKKDKVIENARTGSSQWTYGEPAYYDDFGLPVWSDNYPRIVNTGIRDENGAVLLHYFYTENDYQNITAKQNAEDYQGLKQRWKYWDNGDPNSGCYPCPENSNKCDCTGTVDMPHSEKLAPGEYKAIVRYENDGIQIH